MTRVCCALPAGKLGAHSTRPRGVSRVVDTEEEILRVYLPCNISCDPARKSQTSWRQFSSLSCASILSCDWREFFLPWHVTKSVTWSDLMCRLVESLNDRLPRGCSLSRRNITALRLINVSRAAFRDNLKYSFRQQSRYTFPSDHPNFITRVRSEVRYI